MVWWHARDNTSSPLFWWQTYQLYKMAVRHLERHWYCWVIEGIKQSKQAQDPVAIAATNHQCQEVLWWTQEWEGRAKFGSLRSIKELLIRNTYRYGPTRKITQRYSWDQTSLLLTTSVNGTNWEYNSSYHGM